MHFDGAFVGFADVGVCPVVVAPDYPHQFGFGPHGAGALEQGLQKVELAAGQADSHAVDAYGSRVSGFRSSPLWRSTGLWVAAGAAGASVPDTCPGPDVLPGPAHRGTRRGHAIRGAGKASRGSHRPRYETPSRCRVRRYAPSTWPAYASLNCRIRRSTSKPSMSGSPTSTVTHARLPRPDDVDAFPPAGRGMNFEARLAQYSLDKIPNIFVVFYYDGDSKVGHGPPHMARYAAVRGCGGNTDPVGLHRHCENTHPMGQILHYQVTEIVKLRFVSNLRDRRCKTGATGKGARHLCLDSG